MLKLHDIFLRKFLLLFTSIFLVLGAIIYFWVKDIYIERTKKDLINNIDIAALSIKSLNNANNYAKSIYEATDFRVTIIDQKGIVIGESHEDKSKMDNHLNRAEVIESKYQKFGSIIRYSDTLDKELLYVSKRYNLNDLEYYIRMARDIEEINNQFIYLSTKIAILFLFFIALAFWVAINISKNVQTETTAILDFLDNLTRQNKAHKIDSSYSIEFNKITKLLTEVSSTLLKKDKQKSKYTAKLKLSNRQKDDIISAISHEFKNPIAVISGYTQTILEDKDINPNIREKFLKKISSSSKKLTNMIDRLRLSLKLEEGKQPHNFVELDIEKLTQSIIDDLKLTYTSREIHLDTSSCKVKGDETMISIAITNLIENALKYSQDDVNVKLTSKSLQVIDSGIGIKEKDIPKITDKFYRVSSNGWNNSLGVGLSLVSSILKFHKFKLNIQSVENEGSTFTIKFK